MKAGREYLDALFASPQRIVRDIKCDYPTRLPAAWDGLAVLSVCFEETLNLVFAEWHYLHETRTEHDMRPTCAATKEAFMQAMADLVAPRDDVDTFLQPQLQDHECAFGNRWTI